MERKIFNQKVERLYQARLTLHAIQGGGGNGTYTLID